MQYLLKCFVLKLIDTHTHIYLKQFDGARQAVVDRAVDAGVQKQLMPNIDSLTIKPMLTVAAEFPGNCLPMMALHPTSVKANFRNELDIVEKWLTLETFVAIGETGIDLYWDKTFVAQQKESLAQHIHWAEEYNLPLVLHSRNSLNEIFDVLNAHRQLSFTGVFHCFPGDTSQAKRAIDMGFVLGIGGVVTYKKSLMADVVKTVGLDHIVLETDAPYLAPAPHRGKRNESAFLVHIAEQISGIKRVSVEEVASATTANATRLFGL